MINFVDKDGNVVMTENDKGEVSFKLAEDQKVADKDDAAHKVTEKLKIPAGLLSSTEMLNLPLLSDDPSFSGKN